MNISLGNEGAEADSEEFPTVERTQLRQPSINLYYGQSNSGKTRLAIHIISHWSYFYSQPLEKLTLFYAVDDVADELGRKLSANVEFVKHRELRSELLEAERIRSNRGGAAAVFFDDKLHQMSTAKGDLLTSLTRLVTVEMHHSNVVTQTF